MDHTDAIELTQGTLIVFEGIDGTGKSTQLQLLADALRLKRYPIVTTREPTNGVYGNQIRELYINRKKVSRERELELFLLDRREHVEKLLIPCLADKMIVLCDRYYLSTIAYQGAAGFTIDEIAEKNSFAPQPDLALIYEMPTSVSLQRITAHRGDVLNDFEQEESLQKVAQIFSELRYPFIHRINADQSIEAVHEQTHNYVENYLRQFRVVL